MSSPVIKRLLPRKVVITKEEVSPIEKKEDSKNVVVISPKKVVVVSRTPTPEKCRLDFYQKCPLSYKEIKSKITNITFLPDGKKRIDPDYVQKMLEISTKRRFGENTKYPNEKYCDVVKNNPSYIAWLLQRERVVPETLRDYCFISVRERHFK